MPPSQVIMVIDVFQVSGTNLILFNKEVTSGIEAAMGITQFGSINMIRLMVIYRHFPRLIHLLHQLD